MRWIIHATPDKYRELIQDERNQGRLSLAWLTFGYLNGHGWGFLHPWTQLALFPGKGRYGSNVDPASIHDGFLILRWRSFEAAFKHPNHTWYIEGRYWRGWVWRAEWGLRWGFWPKFRYCLLDPDIVTDDPGQAEDWDGW